ncbi:hypothetical protein E3E36_05005 [Thermococcus sp. M36]|uniref:hypothetical protein n=1 Tax=Thermococcus sp. M36 TaxID=1638261 RepID=UPI00143BF1B9|nr:hypothetical protein [Thermococcus sp. M36]NJE05509.1 hypothetical protein [Thermococcus sp. M36]
MEYFFRLLTFLRLSLRLFAFVYPLSLTVMYNFWVFGRLPMGLWTCYVLTMAVWELVLGLFAHKPFSRPLLKAYVVLALFLEFPSALVGAYLSTVEVFLPWVSLWYGSLLVMGFLVGKTSGQR